MSGILRTVIPLHPLVKVPTVLHGEVLLSFNTESLNGDHNGKHVRSVPCYLHAKDLIYIFQKRIGALQPLKKTKFFIPTFSVSLKSFTRLSHPFSHFYIGSIYYWTCSYPKYSWNTVRWTLINNPSIKHPHFCSETWSVYYSPRKKFI